MSTVLIPGDVRSTAINRESHIKPADAAPAANVNGTVQLTHNAPKPVNKAHKAYKTEKERDKGNKTKAKDVLKDKGVVGRSGARVGDILSLMKHHNLEYLAILSEDDILKGVFERAQFFENAFHTTHDGSELLQDMVDAHLTVARTSADTESDIVSLVRQCAGHPHPWLPLFELEKGSFYGLLTLKDLVLFLDQSRSLDIWI
jgi:CBS-domain-containing membrane protein